MNILLDGQPVSVNAVAGAAAAIASLGGVAAGISYVPVALARERLEAVGKWDALVAYLAAQDMPGLIKMLTLRQGIDPTDGRARAALTAIGADPNAILAPQTGA